MEIKIYKLYGNSELFTFIVVERTLFFYRRVVRTVVLLNDIIEPIVDQTDLMSKAQISSTFF